MNLVKIIGDFLLSSWIWNVTFGWLHPVVAGIIMFCMLRFTLKRKRFESFIISVIAQVFAFGLLTAKIVFGLINFIGWQYEPMQANQAIAMMTIFSPSISIGIIYAIFQSLLFIMCRVVWRFNLKSFLIMTWMSNILGALICYALVNMIELWYYVE